MDREINFSKNLKEFRKKAGLSRRTLGETLSYSEKAVEKWESGDAMPPLEVICRLSQILEVPLEMLIYKNAAEVDYYLAIDGGGTKTEFLLEDREGHRMAHTVLGGTNPNDIGMEACRKVLESGIREVCGKMDKKRIAAFAGLAGCGDEKNKAAMRQFFAEFGFGRCETGSDTESAFCLTLHDRDGILLMAGTGTVTYAQKNGIRRRIGGWGWLIDEGGSGYNIGRDALSAVLKAYDGRGPATKLQGLVEKQIGVPPAVAIAAIYRGGKSYIASFAPLVFEAFRAGDAVAEAILNKNAEEMACCVRTARKEWEDDDRPIPVHICGGLCHEADVLQNQLSALLGDGVTLIFHREAMIQGAMACARR